ncbi:cytochrome P450 [Phycomyces blakesleeanus]
MADYLSILSSEVQRFSTDHPQVAAAGALGAMALSLLYTGFGSKKASPDGAIPLPQPRGRMPVIGHLWSIVKAPHIKMAEYSKELGPIYQMSFGGRDYIVLNSPEVIKGVLETNGSKNSDRVPSTIVLLMSDNGLMWAWGADNSYLRKSRRLFHNGFINKTNWEKNFPELYNNQVGRILRKIRDHGTADEGYSLMDVCYLYTINVSMSVLFNRDYESCDDPDFLEMNAVAHDFSDLGVALQIECPKILEFAISPFMNNAKRLQNKFRSVFSKYIKELREKRAKGIIVKCLISDILDVQEKEQLTEPELDNFAAASMVGATDTTALSLANLLVTLANYPEVQLKVQKELDTVVGIERHPTEQDLINLPYTKAVITECLRFCPPVWISLPHMSRERQVYNGYEIPANTGILQNIYATNMSPELFDKPEEFNPDRYYKEELLKPNQRDHWSFGNGRRTCPGNIFAEKSLQYFTARILWAYTLTTPLDKNGNPIPVPMTDIKDPISQPAHCNIRYVPRRANVGSFV